MLIRITHDDIRNGTRGSTVGCPAACAVLRATGADYVHVHPLKVAVRVAGQLFECRTPAVLADFVHRVDGGDPNVQPIEFELPLEAVP